MKSLRLKYLILIIILLFNSFTIVKADGSYSTFVYTGGWGEGNNTYSQYEISLVGIDGNDSSIYTVCFETNKPINDSNIFNIANASISFKDDKVYLTFFEWMRTAYIVLLGEEDLAIVNTYIADNIEEQTLETTPTPEPTIEPTPEPIIETPTPEPTNPPTTILEKSISIEKGDSWGSGSETYTQYKVFLNGIDGGDVSLYTICIESNQDFNIENIVDIPNTTYKIVNGKLYITFNAYMRETTITFKTNEGLNVSSASFVDSIPEEEVSPTPNPLEAPNVVGQNINDVKATLEKWACDNCVEFCTEYCYNDSYGECIIYDQKFENNKLTIYVSKGSEPLEVPNVVGQNINDVKATLEKWACDNCVEFCIDYEYNETIDECIIYDQKFENNKLIIYVSDGSAYVEDEELGGEISNPNFGIVEGNPIVIDGYYKDWEDKPAAYIYNWDNSQNCWVYGVWIDGVCYKTKEGTYDTNVRHKAQLFCDGEYVYLHLTFSKDYGYFQNGNDFQFYVDGECASFQVQTPNREEIVNHMYDVGIHDVLISHRNNDESYEQAIGSQGYLTCYNEKNQNNQLEIKIPLSELQRQNSNIDLEDFSTIEWFSPNLGYERITITCTPTIPVVVSFIMFIGVIGSYGYYSNKEKNKNKED